MLTLGDDSGWKSAAIERAIRERDNLANSVGRRVAAGNFVPCARASFKSPNCTKDFMPTVLLGGRQKETESEVSVSLERTPLVVGDVRKALPQLKKELSKQWPVVWIDIEIERPRLRNPHDPTQIIKAARVVLTTAFSLGIAGASTEFGKLAAREISKHVRRWIKNFGKQKKKKRRKSPSRR